MTILINPPLDTDLKTLSAPIYIDTRDIPNAINVLGFDVVRRILEKFGLQHLLMEIA